MLRDQEQMSAHTVVGQKKIQNKETKAKNNPENFRAQPCPFYWLASVLTALIFSSA